MTAEPQTERSRPFLPPRFVIRAAWILHRALYRFTGHRRGLWTPTEQLLVSTGPTHVPANPAGQHVTIDQFRGLVFERDGQYLVELLSDDETARYYPLQVVVTPGPPL